MQFQEVFERIKRETEVKTLTNIANLLNKSQQYVSKKKREGEFPAEWAFIIAQKYGLSTEWVLTGRGPKTPEGEIHDSYLVMLEQWLEEYTAPDPRKKVLFELTIEKEFPEFKEWMRKKSEENQNNSVQRVA